MISKQEVKHIAKLARLGLTQDEIRKFQKDLSSILDYIEKLKELDVSKIEPMNQLVLVENVMREDKEKEKELEVQKKLIEAAPEIKDGYIKTRPIL